MQRNHRLAPGLDRRHIVASAWTASIRHDRTGAPSSSTVQQRNAMLAADVRACEPEIVSQWSESRRRASRGGGYEMPLTFMVRKLSRQDLDQMNAKLGRGFEVAAGTQALGRIVSDPPELEWMRREEGKPFAGPHAPASAKSRGGVTLRRSQRAPARPETRPR